jgi:hypothetical protein
VLVPNHAYGFSEEEMKQPTIEQLKTFWRMSVRASNLLQSIDLVRLDERNDRIVMLIEDTIQIEIFPSGEVIIQ